MKKKNFKSFSWYSPSHFVNFFIYLLLFFATFPKVIIPFLFIHGEEEFTMYKFGTYLLKSFFIINSVVFIMLYCDCLRPWFPWVMSWFPFLYFIYFK